MLGQEDDTKGPNEYKRLESSSRKKLSSRLGFFSEEEIEEGKRGGETEGEEMMSSPIVSREDKTRGTRKIEDNSGEDMESSRGSTSVED